MLQLPNQLITVDINFRDKARHIIVPLPLFIIDDLLEGWWFWRIVLRQVTHRVNVESFQVSGMDLTDLLNVGVVGVQRMWHHIRRTGKFEMVDMATQSISLKIKFY